ncbi:MAG TPA: tRNA preQ1(34) S-adenosylmethionine ribosyltransferase-isomerase QueA [Kofleriaceae bacterium]|nr:tRNA preQ1(34) S-adenosylmethionine ribosyltransferase-isomerase QueA [Kofleriaceae bacterium]
MWRASDYDYELPPELIAQVPAERRDASRLLVVDPATGAPSDRRFADIVELLPEGAVLVVNDTRVIPARLRARKPSGGAVELLLLEPQRPGAFDGPWIALARASKPLRAGAALELADGTVVRVVTARAPGDRDATLVVALEGCADPLDLLDRLGEVPLPPYIERAPGASAAADRERYQTVYAAHPGAAAAPTAGLHFTPELLATLETRGVTRAAVTLHVGLGTFAPVRDDDLRHHRMHTERFTIPPATAALVASGRPIVAVGTTVVRALEAAATAPRTVAPGPGSTDLFIGPDHTFRAVDHLVTNFHLPGSTLLVLVSAFAGRDRVLAAYRHAVAARYRFFSYGDAMLLSRPW